MPSPASIDSSGKPGIGGVDGVDTPVTMNVLVEVFVVVSVTVSVCVAVVVKVLLVVTAVCGVQTVLVD
jgi:hypothetical protein